MSLLVVACLSFVFLVFSQYQDWVLRNAVIQLLWFIPSACIPAYRTGRMSFVDIAWPWGLVLLGVQALYFGPGYFPRRLIISLQFVAAGLRMGLGGLYMLSKGWLKNELPRYKYQAMRWKRKGIVNVGVEMQKEILVQALANATTLCIPILLQAFDTTPSISMVEIVGYLLWIGSLGFESVADAQKQSFIIAAAKKGDKQALCNVGLWRYSRHPNYFGEWMVWNSLIVSSLPSLWALYSEGSMHIGFLAIIGGMLLGVSYSMYFCLVHYTGARPAEHFSLQKRPQYADYQKTTNMFFPGPPRA